MHGLKLDKQLEIYPGTKFNVAYQI